MSKIRTLVIAPYEGLRKLALNVANEMDDIDVKVEVGDMENGVQAVLEQGYDQYDVIISRGGTAEMIEQQVSIPVVNIDISGYDFVRAIALSNGFTGKSAIVGFSNITKDALAMKDVMKSEIDVFTISNKDKLELLLCDLKKQDYRIILGDVVTTNQAKRMGFNGILLTSGVESMRKAFEETRKIFHCVKQYRDKCILFEQILEKGMQYTVIFKINGEIYYNNLPDEEKQRVSMELTKYLDNLMKVGSLQIMLEFSGYLWKVSGRMLTDEDGQKYIVFYLQKSETSRKIIQGITISNAEYESKYPTQLLGAYVSHLEEPMQRIRELNKLDVPIMMIGEPGTGKDVLAHAAYLTGKNNLHPMITVDCESVNDEELMKFHEYLADLVQTDTMATFYIRRLDCLSLDGQKIIYNLLNQELPRRFCVITSMCESPDTMLVRGTLHEPLGRMLGEYRVYIPSLKEEKSSIRELTNSFINEANSKYGKQVVAMDEASVDMLKNYPWDANLIQLERVVHQLVLSSEGAYISEESTRKALHNEAMASLVKNSHKWNPNKTLDQIIMDIIKETMDEENGNLTRTSKRLGISRSTLWRKISLNE